MTAISSTPRTKRRLLSLQHLTSQATASLHFRVRGNNLVPTDASCPGGEKVMTGGPCVREAAEGKAGPGA